MEDNDARTTFTPTFTGIHRLFRLPFASVYVPVIPCVYDGTLSILELIARIHHNLNQVIEACNQNHTDIMNLSIYIDSVIDDLTAYIDAQDAATLGASKDYADGLVAALREWTVEQLALKQDLLTFDDTPTDGSSNPVTSDGIYDALAGKQDNLTFDSTPTDGSSNPVTSDGIYDALALKQDVLTFDTVPTDGSSNPVTSDGIYDALALKQDVLTFDLAPTENSTNPAQSGGIFAAIAAVRAPYGFPISADRDNTTVTTPVGITFSMLYDKLHTRHVLVFAEGDISTTDPAASRGGIHYFYVTDYDAAAIYLACDPREFPLERWIISVSSSDVWTFTIETRSSAQV